MFYEKKFLRWHTRICVTRTNKKLQEPLYVQFINEKLSTKIERFCDKFQKRKKHMSIEKLFPLQLAWAITIH